LGCGLITRSCKKHITETRSRIISNDLGDVVVTPHTMRSSMMHGGESHTEALGQMRPLVHPKNVMKIGNWNVRTLYQSGNIAQASRDEKERY